MYEGVSESKVVVTGNTVIYALLIVRVKLEVRQGFVDLCSASGLWQKSILIGIWLIRCTLTLMYKNRHMK